MGVPGGCSSPAKRPTKASAPGLGRRPAAAQQSSESERGEKERERGKRERQRQRQRQNEDSRREEGCSGRKPEGVDGGKKNARASCGPFFFSFFENSVFFFFRSLLFFIL